MNATATLGNARALRWRAAQVLEALQTLKGGRSLDEDQHAALLELSDILDEYTAHTSRGGITPISRGLLDDQAVATWKSAKLTFEREAADPTRLSRMAQELRRLAQVSATNATTDVPAEIETFCVRLLEPAEE